jgi:hypothetical protein
MIAEKNLSRKNDRERHNNHHCKRQRHQPYAAGPSKNCTAAICATPPEKPATQNYKTEQEHRAVSNPYRYGLAEGEHMIKNDKDQHNAREKKTGLPQDAVAKKTGSELQKSRVGNENHCHKNEPWNDHKRMCRSPSNETQDQRPRELEVTL